MRTILFLFAVLFSVAGYGQQQMLLRGAAAGGDVGILDAHPVDGGCYCACWVNTAYTGPILRIRRASDNAELDISREGQGIDEAAIVSHCSGTDCFVVTWYDQSGNGYDVTQATATSQPRIATAGVVTTENGEPTIDFDGGDVLINANRVFSGVFTSFYVSSSDNAEAVAGVYNQVADDPTKRVAGFFDTRASTRRLGIYQEFVNVISEIDGSEKLFAFGYDGSSIYGNINGVSQGTTPISPGVDETNAFEVGRQKSGSLFLDGRIKVMIIYDSDQSANRAAIETALNNYFSIY